MKRISLLSILMVLFLSAASPADEDFECYVPLRFRMNWSPYAEALIPGLYEYSPYDLQYGSVGLITGCVEYSPYAFQYGSSGLIYDLYHYSPYALTYGGTGLVNRCVHYSPYAFGFNKSGLIADASPGCCGSYLGSTRNVINVITDYAPQNTRAYRTETFASYARRENMEDFYARRAKLEAQQIQIRKIQKEKSEDPSQAIREILDRKNIPFTTNRMLSINGKTVSVNFYIEDANIIVKFWNSKEIIEIKKAKDYREDLYNTYLKSCEEYFMNEVGNTKKVYYIVAGSKEEIYKQLDPDDELKSSDNMYALAQNRP